MREGGEGWLDGVGGMSLSDDTVDSLNSFSGPTSTQVGPTVENSLSQRNP